MSLQITERTLCERVRQEMRSVRWPQDLDGKMKVVELYVVNDYSQVCLNIPFYSV